MKDVKKSERYDDYDEIIDSFEVEVLIKMDYGEYSGDTFLLVRDAENGRIGIIIFGWGSCSGCDDLQGCNLDLDPHKAVTDLRDEIWNGARWERDAKAMLEYVTAKDWTLEFQYHTSGWMEFNRRMIVWLVNNSE